MKINFEAVKINMYKYIYIKYLCIIYYGTVKNEFENEFNIKKNTEKDQDAF